MFELLILIAKAIVGFFAIIFAAGAALYLLEKTLKYLNIYSEPIRSTYEKYNRYRSSNGLMFILVIFEWIIAYIFISLIFCFFFAILLITGEDVYNFLFHGGPQYGSYNWNLETLIFFPACATGLIVSVWLLNSIIKIVISFKRYFDERPRLRKFISRSTGLFNLLVLLILGFGLFWVLIKSILLST